MAEEVGSTVLMCRAGLVATLRNGRNNILGWSAAVGACYVEWIATFVVVAAIATGTLSRVCTVLVAGAIETVVWRSCTDSTRHVGN